MDIITLLQMQLQLKLYHWQTKSHARHVASDKFVGAIGSSIDRLVEAYQGRYGIITVKEPIALENISDDKILSFMNKMRKFLVDELPKMFDKKDTHLFNIRDEMLEALDVAVYLFNQK